MVGDRPSLEPGDGRNADVCEGLSVRLGDGCCIGWLLRRGEGIRNDDSGVPLLSLDRSVYGGVRVLVTGETGAEQVPGWLTGTLISNSEPWSTRLVEERTQTRSPPIFLARPLATRSPNPKPSLLRVVEASSRANGWKMFGKNFSGIPGPVSRTDIKTSLGRRPVVAATVIVPLFVNLIALRKTHEINLAKSRSSTRSVSGNVGSTDQSIVLQKTSPFEDLERISILSPDPVASLTTKSGLPPTWSDSLMTNRSRSRSLVDLSAGFFILTLMPSRRR